MSLPMYHSAIGNGGRAMPAEYADLNVLPRLEDNYSQDIGLCVEE